MQNGLLDWAQEIDVPFCTPWSNPSHHNSAYLKMPSGITSLNESPLHAAQGPLTFLVVVVDLYKSWLRVAHVLALLHDEVQALVLLRQLATVDTKRYINESRITRVVGSLWGIIGPLDPGACLTKNMLSYQCGDSQYQWVSARKT